MDQLALTTAYEVSQFTQGTEHFPNASHATDAEVTAAYSDLVPLVEANEQATNSLFSNQADNDPPTVADESVESFACPTVNGPSAAWWTEPIPASTR